MKDFVTPEIAEELNKLGFNEPCLASWNYYTNQINYNQGPSNFHSEDVIQLPTYSQTFRWFREKYGLYSWTTMELGNKSTFCWVLSGEHTSTQYAAYFNTYEEAELACLIKLIEIVKNKKS